MKNPVLVADFADEVEVLARWCDAEGIARAKVTAVGLEREAQAAFRKLGFAPKNTLPYLTGERHRAVFLQASRYARSWFKTLPAGTLELLSHDGTSYPECLEYDFSVAFTEVFLHAELVSAIVEQEHPDPLVLVDTGAPQARALVVTAGERLLFPVAVEVCRLGDVPLKSVPAPRGFGKTRRELPALGPLLHKARDIFQTSRMEERPLTEFLGRSLPVAFSFAFPGKMIYRRKLERYRRAPRKILFWGGTRGNECLRQALQQGPGTESLLLGEKRRLRFRQYMMPRVDPREISGIRSEERAAIRKQADAAWEAIRSDRQFQGSFHYGVVPLWPMMQSRLEFYVRRHFPQCVEYYEATRNFLREQGGDVLVSTVDSGGFTPWVCRAFSRMGVGSIYFWHGLLIPHEMIEEGLSPAFLPLQADRVAAFGEGIADWYKENGVAAERIRLVGSPDLDLRGKDISPRRKRMLCGLLGLDPTRPIIVYATSVTRYGGRRAYSEETADEIFRATEDIVQELSADPDLQVVIKLHPGLSARELATFRQLARPFPNAVVCQMPELGWLLQLCDILITYQSSAGIEALAYDRNVIIYNTTGRANQYTPHAMRLEDEEAGLVLLVDDRSRLRPAAHRLLTDETLRGKLRDRRRQLDPYVLFNSDGRALDRALSLVEEALANGSSELRDPVCQTRALASR